MQTQVGIQFQKIKQNWSQKVIYDYGASQGQGQPGRWNPSAMEFLPIWEPLGGKAARVRARPESRTCLSSKRAGLLQLLLHSQMVVWPWHGSLALDNLICKCNSCFPRK